MNLRMDVGMETAMDVDVGTSMDVTIDNGLDTFAASSFSPTQGLQGPGHIGNYGTQGFQGFQTLYKSNLSNDHLVPNYQAPPALPGYLTNPPYPAVPIAAPAAPAVTANAAIQGQFTCTLPNCLVAFYRDTDRIRHESSVHGVNRPLYLCPIPGCIKGHGAGYTRRDKLTEHMWKKHAALGFVRRA
ncbi:hypothetical protein DL98DRAFT_514430 [Cadophora sp. DSE1049]|nr:hypothetical protein DL98DRAFT_514430 [Cadophora sp. DSE1049]